MNPAMPRRGLYLVTRESVDTASLLHTVAQALTGGVVLVQYRDKSAASALRLEQARRLVQLCAAHGVPLVVNDDLELAIAAGAAGAHLGEHDADPAHARARLGGHEAAGLLG